MNKTIALSGRMGVGKDTIADLLNTNHGYVTVGFADALKRFTIWLFNLEYDLELFWGSSEERNKELSRTIDKKEIEVAIANIHTYEGYVYINNLLLGDAFIYDAIAKLEEVLTPKLPIKSPRTLLQLMGTEWGRSLWEDVWLNAVKHTKQGIEEGVPYFRRDGLLTNVHTKFKPSPIVIPDCRYLNEAKYVVENLNGAVVWIDAARVPINTKFIHSSEVTREALFPYITSVVHNNAPVMFLPSLVSSIVEDINHLPLVTRPSHDPY